MGRFSVRWRFATDSQGAGVVRHRVAGRAALLAVTVTTCLGLGGPAFGAVPAWAAPTAGPDAGAERTLHDLPYAGQAPGHLLDLYLPAGPTGSAAVTPVVVVIHGGAFSAGGRGDEQDTVQALIGRGYAVADVEYRLSGEEPFPASVRDVKAAVRWLRAHTAEYGLDPGRIAAWGTSAGGYLAAMIGASGDQYTGLDDPSLGNPEHSSAVEAVVDLYGPTDFLQMDTQLAAAGCPQQDARHDAADSPESRYLQAPIQSVQSLAAAASPISYVRAARTLPRFLIGHGSTDCTVPAGQSEALAVALQLAGVPADYRVLTGAGHADPRFGSELQTPAIDFLDRSLGVHGSG
jgi:acetyl esterase/lipase